MKVKIVKNKDTEFKNISFYETEIAGTCFRVNEEITFEDNGGAVDFIDFYHVLMVLDQDYLQDYEGGELALNLSTSKIVFVPFKTKIVLLETTNETTFEEIMYEEPEE